MEDVYWGKLSSRTPKFFGRVGGGETYENVYKNGQKNHRHNGFAAGTKLTFPLCSMGAVLGHSHGGGSSHSHGGGDHGHSHGEQENINVKAAFIHVVGDFLQASCQL